MDNFINTLNYLGGNLGLSPKTHKFVDLELFYLECSLYLNADNRVKQTILNWLYRYAPLLSPSKIRRLIKCHKYDKENLGILSKFLIEHKTVKENWNILINSKRIKVIAFKENSEKYLKLNKFILKNVPEIRYRAEGRNQIISDILSFTSKSTFKSLYELAKCIHSPRNRVNESYKQLLRFELL